MTVCPSVCVRTSELSACMRVRGGSSYGYGALCVCTRIRGGGSGVPQKALCAGSVRSLGRAIPPPEPLAARTKDHVSVKMDWHQ